ncbi:MAG: SGNH/GDSL hydrolase family protein [bacterium]|nr:SGNH/GDSL hydrolase family protein [bacterium]
MTDNAKTILCYGDSNTWGYIPGTGERHPRSKRWVNILQSKLGEDYEVISEGCNSRTTTLDDPDNVDKNGMTYLLPCLVSHKPINLVILMLGTNDAKAKFNVSAFQIASQLEELINVIQKSQCGLNNASPKVLLISPPIIKVTPGALQKGYKGADIKSKEFGKYYQEVAHKYGCDFLNSAEIIESSDTDGYHFEPSEHAKLAESIYNKINNTY